MTPEIQSALETDRTIDITTTGRKSGQLRRIEIWFKNVAGRIYITGTPFKRDWYANMLAEPAMVFHIKKSVQADLPARARPIIDPAERAQVLHAPNMAWYHENSDSSEAFVRDAPLVEVVFDETSP
jgi:hypothetical protein